MVQTTPPKPADSRALDGFGSLDGETATLIFGGVSDGTIDVIVTGFAQSPILGKTVRAQIERAPFVSRSTVVTQTELLSDARLTVVDDRITVTLPNANATDGYRLKLSPSTSIEGEPDAGGSAGSAGSGGAQGGDGGSGGAVAPIRSSRHNAKAGCACSVDASSRGADRGLFWTLLGVAGLRPWRQKRRGDAH